MAESDLILLALEDAQILQLFERALLSASYRIAIAPDRDSLDKTLQESSPALLIISERFSDGKGLDLAQTMIERFPTLPVLLFAAHGSSEVLHSAIRLGISDCLFPPLRPGDIAQIVEGSLKKSLRMGDWTRREVKRTTASLEQKINELQKFDTILNHIEDGVIILDSAGKLLLINPAARRAFGLGNEDIRGKKVDDIIPHPDLRTLIALGPSNPNQYHEISFEDEQIFNAQFAPIPGIGVAVTMQNITYLKQIDRLKSEFVSTVSHDLRSPLTAIMGYVELLDRVGPLNDQQKDFVRRVHTSVQSVTALINDLLELGRIEAGISGQNETVPLDAVLKFTLENFSVQINEKSIKVHTNIQEDVPLIYGNPVRIRQMLDNLIGNAVKYTPIKGDISISIAVEGDNLIFKVSDTGPGIPPADQPHIFEKFYRGSNVSTKVSGSGLGLAIVKSIVENHHGRIWVDSVYGRGSTFVVVFPYVKN
jgi:signal transduction histidine kinase/DNA-binding NarL/FixJ family response regulator